MPKNPFEFHKPTVEQNNQMADVRVAYNTLHDFLLTLPICRERSLAITNLEQSCMWAVKGIVMQEDSAA